MSTIRINTCRPWLSNIGNLLLCLLVSGLFWFGMLYTSGSITSGFHLHEDEETFQIDNKLKNQSVYRVFIDTIKYDYQTVTRFRPFYYAHRILVTYILGINFFWWYVYIGMLAVFTSFFLFLWARKLGFSLTEAAIFLLLTLIGPQATIWWRAGGPNEAIGMFILSLALLCMSNSALAKDKSKQVIYDIVFVFFVLLASLSKESFIILIPALVFLRIWLQQCISKQSFRETFHEHIVLTTILSTILAAELAVIAMRDVNWRSVSLAGMNLWSYIKTGFRLTLAGGGLALIAAILIIIADCCRKKRFDSLRSLLPPFIAFALICLPQIILHSKIGIQERYLLPALLGYAFVFIFVFRYLKQQNILMVGCLSLTYGKSRFLGALMIVAGFMILLFNNADSFLLNCFLKIWTFERPETIDILKNIIRFFIIFSYAFLLVAGMLLCFFSNRMFAFLQKITAYQFILLFVVLCISFQTALSFRRASYFADDGRNSNLLLNFIQTTSTPDATLLIVADPFYNYEQTFSLLIYFDLISKRNNIFVAVVKTSHVYDDLANKCIKQYEELLNERYVENLADKTKIDAIAILPGDTLEKMFLKNYQYMLNTSEFQRTAFGHYVIYSKIKSADVMIN